MISLIRSNTVTRPMRTNLMKFVPSRALSRPLASADLPRPSETIPNSQCFPFVKAFFLIKKDAPHSYNHITPLPTPHPLPLLPPPVPVPAPALVQRETQRRDAQGAAQRR